MSTARPNPAPPGAPANDRDKLSTVAAPEGRCNRGRPQHLKAARLGWFRPPSGLLLLAGCSAGQVTQTDTQVAAVNGGSGSVKEIAVHNAQLSFPTPGSSTRGPSAPCRSLANEGEDDRLVESPARPPSRPPSRARPRCPAPRCTPTGRPRHAAQQAQPTGRNSSPPPSPAPRPSRARTSSASAKCRSPSTG